MAELPFRILQVGTTDVGGGAERVAWNLFRAYRARGHRSWMAVGHKRGDDPDVLVMPPDAGSAGRPTLGCETFGRRRSGPLRRWLTQGRRVLEQALGVEDFNYPGTRGLLHIPPERPDILHCHNLHGAYFDLRILPQLSRELPVVLTLHDAWLLSGHCAHSFDCERWKTGCGRCPDLTIYPAVRRDATTYNWRRKSRLFARSRLHVSTPCAWLMRKVEHSMLAPGTAEARVIPYGVDLSVFRPADRQSVRAALGLAADAKVLLFASTGIRRSPWKDYETMRSAVSRVAEGLPAQSCLFVALGEDAPGERIGGAEVRFVPFQKDLEAVAKYYQAADVYVHAARADTFPNVILEALACGTPVVATAVGGIPEQIRPLRNAEGGMGKETNSPDGFGPDEATGMLVSRGDAGGMARAVTALLTDDGLRCMLGRNAAKHARQYFDLERQVRDYLSWYAELTERWSDHRERSHGA